jgi:hypothetical protein
VDSHPGEAEQPARSMCLVRQMLYCLSLELAGQLESAQRLVA